MERCWFFAFYAWGKDSLGRNGTVRGGWKKVAVWVRSKRQFPIASCFEQKKKALLNPKGLENRDNILFSLQSLSSPGGGAGGGEREVGARC